MFLFATILTLEVVETELRVVLNTLTDCRIIGDGAYVQKGNALRVMVASKPEVSF
jgi:hypothetical protein